MASPPKHSAIPASLAKYFKTTAKAQRLMDADNRLCDLDSESNNTVLVYSIHPGYHKGEFKWGDWSQKQLWEASQNGMFLSPTCSQAVLVG